MKHQRIAEARERTKSPTQRQVKTVNRLLQRETAAHKLYQKQALPFYSNKDNFEDRYQRWFSDSPEQQSTLIPRKVRMHKIRLKGAAA